MRKKVRGLRKIEQAVLKRQGVEESKRHAADDPDAMTPVDVGPTDTPAAAPDADSADAVVLDYCAAVRGILNDDQGGPLHPPGLRMAEALGEVRESIQRNLDEQKGGSPSSNSADWPAASTAASTQFETEQETIRDVRQGHRGSRRDPRTRRADLRRAAGEVRGIDRSTSSGRRTRFTGRWPR